MLLMNIGGSNGAGIVAIDKRTGRTLWKTLSVEAGYSSPTVASIGGQRHAIFFTREGLVGVDPANGRIRYQQRWRSRQAASVIEHCINNAIFSAKKEEAASAERSPGAWPVSDGSFRGNG
jgi:outer membrane protein assembly factor BamB